MCLKRLMIYALLAAPLLAYAPPYNKVAVVDVYILNYVINGKLAPTYTDDNGTVHVSGHEFYTSTVVHGTMGGAVKYRFFLESINLTYPPGDTMTTKFNMAGPPMFKNSSAEMIDSASVAPDVIAKLPPTFTNPENSKKGKKY